MFLEDLVEVTGVDAWDGALSAKLEWNAIRLVSWVTVGDVDAKGTVIELGALGIEGHLDDC